MKSSKFTSSARQHATLLAAFPLLALGHAKADLTTDMVAYYDFEQTGVIGLANKAPGATGGDLTWNSTPTLGQTGFSGDAAFNNPLDGLSNRGTLLAGNALNVVDSENAIVVSPYGSADLGSTFTISIWTYLAPGATNGSGRFHALEGSDSYDVSWGSTSNVSSTGYDDYLAYVDTTSTSTISGLGKEAWQHVVLVYDTTGNPTVSAYVNGSTIPITATDTSATFAFSDLHIGNARGTYERQWDGMIDEVAIWDRALTTGEIGEVHALGLAGDPLTEGGGGSVVSLSNSNPAAGTISGGGFYGTLGTVVPIAASPNPGYVFVSWDGDFTGQPASFSYTTTASNVSSTATFAEDTSDPDGDDLTTYEELVIYGTLPNEPDSDDDMIPDGDEVNLTRTDPTTSDSALVDFVAANLCPDTAGAVAMSHPLIERNGSTNDVLITLSFVGSADQTAWSVLPLSDPAFLIAPSATGEGWDVTLPAPSNSVDSYILLGRKP